MVPAAAGTDQVIVGEGDAGLLHTSRAAAVYCCDSCARTVGLAGDTVMVAAGPATIVTVAFAERPFDVTVTPLMMVPGAQAAVSTPAVVIVPAVASADQVNVAPGTGLFAASNAAAVNETVPPAATLVIAGVRVTRSTAPGANGNAPRSLMLVPAPRAGEVDCRRKSAVPGETSSGSPVIVFEPCDTLESGL